MIQAQQNNSKFPLVLTLVLLSPLLRADLAVPQAAIYFAYSWTWGVALFLAVIFSESLTLFWILRRWHVQLSYGRSLWFSTLTNFVTTILGLLFVLPGKGIGEIILALWVVGFTLTTLIETAILRGLLKKYSNITKRGTWICSILMNVFSYSIITVALLLFEAYT